MGTEHTVAAIGGRLRAARALRGMSQNKLAQAVQRQSTMISHIEAGRRQPSLVCFVRICQALNISADYLLGATPPITVPGFEAVT